MAWIGLHTSQNIDPHATLVWVKDKNLHPACLLHRAKQIVARLPSQLMTVSHLEQFGVRQNIEVAMLHPTEDVAWAVEFLADQHESDWPIRPHVTAHEGRQVFHFQWLGLHLPDESRYWRLGCG